MFLADGYEATTAEAIAENVGASVRTFFRYFATKDEVVFKGQGLWAKKVTASYMQQPESLPRIDAICESLVEAAEGMDRKSVVAYGKIVENSHVLRGKAAELIAISTDEVADAVAKKQGLDEPDAATRLFTQVVFATYQAAVKDWRDERFPGSLEEAIREKFRLFHTLFADTENSAGSAMSTS
ncbi:transcriptional regulator, TetR family [Novosphingobium sp. CF614]|nr:transcriptional regulator, TetR family [Novosphingobium sp. CF614]